MCVYQHRKLFVVLVVKVTNVLFISTSEQFLNTVTDLFKSQLETIVSAPIDMFPVFSFTKEKKSVRFCSASMTKRMLKNSSMDSFVAANMSLQAGQGLSKAKRNMSWDEKPYCRVAGALSHLANTKHSRHSVCCGLSLIFAA